MCFTERPVQVTVLEDKGVEAAKLPVVAVQRSDAIFKQRFGYEQAFLQGDREVSPTFLLVLVAVAI